jgi:hypothetical protein
MSEQPETPQAIVSSQPVSKRLVTSSSETTSSKGLRFYLQDSANQLLSGTPVSAIFLVQFDVKTGYELKWSKSIDDSISLKGVEFKSLPSGLHEVERDVISFVQPKTDNSLDDLLYGVSVFHQNLIASRDSTRANVKMFSLGILVDPSFQKTSSFKLTRDNWKPIDYTKGLEYVDHLHRLLDSWNSSDSTEFSLFEDFFDQHSKNNLIEQSVLKSPKATSSISKLTSTTHSKHHSHHYLLKLPKLLETLGPLVFQIWRKALLRERILLFDAPTVELNCSFTYCISILSTLPQDVAYFLNEDGHLKEGLKFLQPLYSVGVNDIDWLKRISNIASVDDSNGRFGFIASSSDEILSYKKEIHDIAVKFNEFSNIPEVIPSYTNSISTKASAKPLKSTQRDLNRFKILTKEFNLKSIDSNRESVDENGDLKWWNDVTEPLSWRQIAWSGFYWWASAGERSRVEFEQEYEGLADIDSVDDEIERALSIVGYFHRMTKRIFTILLDILNNEASSVDKVQEDDNTLYIETTDVFEMGLDPYSSQDLEFIIKLVKVWFNRDTKIGSSLTNICCSR